MTVLRVYDPAECDVAGVPLDWERCRACRGSAAHDSMLIVTDCEVCDGHGSLKAAALRERSWEGRAPRCEDCGHPMSAGTWEVGTSPDEWDALTVLRGGVEPALAGHYSPCDEGCRHGGPQREDTGDGLGWGAWSGPPTPDCGRIEASWRPVDVRTLGWPHDLRPERLAVLCLRCWAKRDR